MEFNSGFKGLNLTRITGTLHEDQYTLLSYLAQFLEREIFLRRIVGKIKTYILGSITFFKDSRALYEIMWKNVVEVDRPQVTVWCVCIACWIPKATNTHSDYVILTAFLLQQWLHERSTMLRIYAHCLSCSDSLHSGTGAMLLLNLRHYYSCLDYCYFAIWYRFNIRIG